VSDIASGQFQPFLVHRRLVECLDWQGDAERLGLVCMAMTCGPNSMMENYCYFGMKPQLVTSDLKMEGMGWVVEYDQSVGLSAPVWHSYDTHFDVSAVNLDILVP
jgi:hypothetical protein